MNPERKNSMWMQEQTVRVPGSATGPATTAAAGRSVVPAPDSRTVRQGRRTRSTRRAGRVETVLRHRVRRGVPQTGPERRLPRGLATTFSRPGGPPVRTGFRDRSHRAGNDILRGGERLRPGDGRLRSAASLLPRRVEPLPPAPPSCDPVMTHDDPTLLIQRRSARFFRSASRCNRAAKAPLDPLGAKNCDQGAICDDASPNALGFRVSESAWDHRGS